MLLLWANCWWHEKQNKRSQIWKQTIRTAENEAQIWVFLFLFSYLLKSWNGYTMLAWASSVLCQLDKQQVTAETTNNASTEWKLLGVGHA